jgi:uncharacterized DUF497 family protein
MKITFDTTKDKINIEKHGFSLSQFEEIDFETAMFEPDKRKEYGEERMRVFGLLDGRLCTAIYTLRDGCFRSISLRKSNARERKRYEKR